MSHRDFTAPRTLIIDDQPDVLEALGLLLKSEGFQTEAVTTPAAVLDAIQSSQFDILLMDLNYARDTTSGQEGLDLLTHVQALDSSLPVVVMTAWGSVELAVEAMRRGVRDFILKPWENHRLISTLRPQIETGRLLRKIQFLKAESKRISNQIRLSTDLKTLLNLTAEHLQKTVNSRAVVVFTRALCERGFCATAKAGIADSVVKDLYFEASSKLLTMLDAPLALRSVTLPDEEKSKLGSIASRFLIPILIKDELIGFISLAGKADYSDYDAEETKFLEAVAAQLGAGINSLRFRGQENEFEEARKIQRGLLPASIPQIPGISIASAWHPASAVSGDYYDVLKFSDSKIALCIADVSGKGMPAALLMSNVQAAVKSFATATLPPAALCAKVNTVVSSNTVDSKFITLCYCLIDTEIRKLFYANAGHNAGFLVRRDGSMKRLECGGTVLGPFPEWAYEEEEVGYRTGDRILLFTDGVTEVTNQDGEEFGEARLLELLIEYHQQPAEQLQQTILSAVAKYSGGSFSDDATLLVVAVE